MKTTKATFKSFINKNIDKLLIRVESDFDGMTDGIESFGDAKFVPIKKKELNTEHTLGIEGIWLVGHSSDYFKKYEDDKYIGIHYYNCCGSGTIAIKNNLINE